MSGDEMSRWEAQAARALAVEAVLAELVALKDGPRDADYERRKPIAWQAARNILRQR